VCTLALLLMRALEARLNAAERPVMAGIWLVLLASGRLKWHELHEMLRSLYTVTRPNEVLAALLRSLELMTLTEDWNVGKVLIPRPRFSA
jgi:hypothetical protein